MYPGWDESQQCESDPEPPPNPTACPYQTQDPIFPSQSPHFCTETINHPGDHECLCGYHWATLEGDPLARARAGNCP
jgi:hypothetical protein